MNGTFIGENSIVSTCTEQYAFPLTQLISTLDIFYSARIGQEQ